MVERTSQYGPAITSLARRMREVDAGEVDDGFRMERSEDRRGRSLRRRRAGLTGAAFLLLAIKAIMRCHTIRVPTLKYDKTIQMLGIRLPSFLDSPSPPSTAVCVTLYSLPCGPDSLHWKAGTGLSLIPGKSLENRVSRSVEDLLRERVNVTRTFYRILENSKARNGMFELFFITIQWYLVRKIIYSSKGTR